MKNKTEIPHGKKKFMISKVLIQQQDTNKNLQPVLVSCIFSNVLLISPCST